MNFFKYTVSCYTWEGSKPLVILLAKPANFKHAIFQTNDINELKKFIDNKQQKVYFVADADDKRIEGLDNWHTNLPLDYTKIESYYNNIYFDEDSVEDIKARNTENINPNLS